MEERDDCYLCKTKVVPLLDNLHDTRLGTEGKYGINICPGCGLGITTPVPSNLAKAYEKVLPSHASRWYRNLYRAIIRSDSGTQLRFTFDRGYKFLNLATMANLTNDSRLLDVGCGIGDWMLLFRRMSFDVYGVDMNPKAVEVAASRGFDVFGGTIDDYLEKGTSESFDIIILSQLLEHLQDPIGMLTSLKSKLNDGGYLLFAVPNFESRYRKKFGTHWINWYIPLHYYHFSIRNLLLILKLSGFELVRSIDYTPPSWWLGSFLVRTFNKKGTRNTKVFAWWNHIVNPFLSTVLSLADRLDPGHGDCLCVLAKTSK